MNKIHTVLFLSLGLLTGACFTSSKTLMNIQQGMTQSEIRNIFKSEPDFRRFDGSTEEWEYHRYLGEWSVVVIRFDDGRVSEMNSFRDPVRVANTTTVVTSPPTVAGTFPNRCPVEEVRVISDAEFDRFHHQLKFTIKSGEQKQMIEKMLQKHDVTSAQCVKIVKEIFHASDQVEMIKKMYPYVRDKRNFNQVIDILFSDTHKNEVREFIKKYHRNNK